MKRYSAGALMLLLISTSACQKPAEQPAANNQAEQAAAQPVPAMAEAPVVEATPESTNPLKAGETITTEKGVTVEIVEPGSGKKVELGSRIRIEYKGMLEDGTEFDKNMIEVESVGRGMVPGMNATLPRLYEGSKVLITIPPEQGYGERRTGPIPPNSTLKFELTVKKIL